MGQVSNGLLMTPMTAVSVANTPMTAVSMGYSNAGGSSRSGVSHSGPQSKSLLLLLLASCFINPLSISLYI